MASERETYEMEIARREDQISQFEEAAIADGIARKQIKDLDDQNAASLEQNRQELIAIYKELRHYTGKEPIVFTEAQVTEYPYFQGPEDDAGNPYYRISVVKAGDDLGLAPLETPPDFVNGRWTRDRSYAPTEDVPRSEASVALKAYPDYTGEPLPQGWPGEQETTPPFCSGITEAQCTMNGGTWDPVNMRCEGIGQSTCEMPPLNGTYNSTGTPIDDPVWVPEETAPELLRPKLENWQRDLIHIRDEAYTKDQAPTQAYYQEVIDRIQNCLDLLPPPAVFQRRTNDPDPEEWGRTPVPQPGEPLYEAIQDLIEYADTGVPEFVADRQVVVQGEADFFENAHFTFVGMRLHAANGSYSKFRALDQKTEINTELVEDHKKVIRQLQVLLTRL